MSDGFNQHLRNEILETQKARSDLLKWKLFLVAIIACVGLGLKESTNVPYAPFVLCSIPFVCFYVDFLCAHLNLRIKVINRYFTLSEQCPSINYEDLCEKARGVFGLETLALIGTTILLSGLLAIGGLLILLCETKGYPSVSSILENYQRICLGIIIAVSGLFGLASTIIVEKESREKLRNLDKIVEELKKKCKEK